MAPLQKNHEMGEYLGSMLCDTTVCVTTRWVKIVSCFDSYIFIVTTTAYPPKILYADNPLIHI